MIKRHALFMAGSLLLNACGGMSLRLPAEVTRYETKIDIISKARVLAVITTKSCDSIKSSAHFEVVPKKKAALPMATRCESGKLIGASDILAPGSYSVQLSVRRGSIKELKPLVTLELANPEFKSGADQYSEGAVALEPGKPLEATVDYILGDTSDWVRVAGEKKRVFLTFTSAENSAAVATVYRAIAGGKPMKLKALPSEKPTAFYLGKDDLLVKVTASNEDGPVAYSLGRRDEDAKKAVSLRVVDAYPVGPDSSLVLLSPNPAVKAEDELRISAKTELGQWKELGACRVNNVSADSIQCELAGAWSERFIEYRATGTAPVSG
jgi:hypothetical protein